MSFSIFVVVVVGGGGGGGDGGDPIHDLHQSTLCVDTICIVSGLVKVGNSTDIPLNKLIGQLDPPCVPTDVLPFAVNHHQYSMEVNVLPTGEIR